MAATVKLLTSCQGGYACDCDICLQVTRFGRREAVECKPSGGGEGGENEDMNEMLYHGIPRDFTWLMHSLLASNEKVKGCELIFPDTAFFKRGKPTIVIKSDPRDFCLIGIRHPKKISLQSIYKEFQNVVRKRRKDFVGPFNKLYFNSSSSLLGARISNQSSTTAAAKQFASNKDFSPEALRRNDSHGRKQ